MEQSQHLLELVYAKQNQQLQEIKKRLSSYSKYFFNIKRNITIIYDKNTVYVIHKDYLKIIELPKSYIITDLCYNHQRNVLLFLTIEGALFVFFPGPKHLVQIKKDYKKIHLIEWIYGVQQVAHLFVAEEGGLHLYRFEEEKKYFKETKHISGKYHCFLYEPQGDILVGFPYGDCQTAYLFNFEPARAKNWFKAGQIQINFQKDEVIADRIKRTKSLGLQSSRTCKQIFQKKDTNEDYFMDCMRIFNCAYICFYMASEGKLRLIPIEQQNIRKPITIKLPSDSVPIFNIVDNMLAVHLKNQRITFIYDIGPVSFQTLVSPYPMVHQEGNVTSAMIYAGEFVGRRVLLNEGNICRWKINLRVIFHFLKNQMMVFQFFNNRCNSKMQIIRWLRDNIFTIKPINLSRIWKHLFVKLQKGTHDESDIVTIVQLYSNLFYTLYIDPLCSKQQLTNVLIQCLRQCNEFHLKIPDELEYLTAQLLLLTKKYDLLTYLCHHNMIKPLPKIFRMIFDESQKTGDQLLLTLSVDVASQSNTPKDMLRLLMQAQRYKQSKRYLKATSDKYEVLELFQLLKLIQNPPQRKEFSKFLRHFVTHKFPSINTTYLDEAQRKFVG